MVHPTVAVDLSTTRMHICKSPLQPVWSKARSLSSNSVAEDMTPTSQALNNSIQALMLSAKQQALRPIFNSVRYGEAEDQIHNVPMSGRTLPTTRPLSWLPAVERRDIAMG